MIMARGGFGCLGSHPEADNRMRFCTFGFFGATGGHLDVGAPNAPTEELAIERDGATWDEPFVQDKNLPYDAADRHAGGYCCITGEWSAGHGLVTVDGKRYLREVAPRPKGR